MRKKVRFSYLLQQNVHFWTFCCNKCRIVPSCSEDGTLTLVVVAPMCIAKKYKVLVDLLTLDGVGKD